MKVRFKLKFIFFKTEYITVEIPDEYILESLELEDIKEIDLSNRSHHSDAIFDFIWDEIKGDVDIEDFEILNLELYPIPPRENEEEENEEEEWKPQFNLKRV